MSILKTYKPLNLPGPQAIQKFVYKLVVPLLRKRGFTDASILEDWPNIIGPKWAGITIPTKISFRKGQCTLHLEVPDGGTALMVRHLEPKILDRLNSYYGYKALTRIKTIVTGVLPKSAIPSLPAPEFTPPSYPLPQELETLPDSDLKQALSLLYQGIRQRTEIKIASNK